MSVLAVPVRPRLVAALRHPVAWVWVLVLAGSVAASAQLTEGVLETGDLARVDPVVAGAVPPLRTPALTALARILDLVGSTAVIGALTVVVAAVLWFRLRDRWAAGSLAGTMAASSLVILGAKHLVGRVRPGAALVLGPVDSSPAFPSGHTLGTVVFLGLLAGLVVTRSHTRWAPVGAVTCWVVGSVAMAASRVYLGYHWTTDVLAGLTLGLGLLAVAVPLVSRRHPVAGPG